MPGLCPFNKAGTSPGHLQEMCSQGRAQNVARQLGQVGRQAQGVQVMLSQVVRHRHRAPPCNTDALPSHSVAWPVGGLRHTGTQEDQKTAGRTQQRAGFRDVRQNTANLVFGSQADKMPQDFIHNREQPRDAQFDVASTSRLATSRTGFSLLMRFRSLLSENLSLLIFSGNLMRNRCSTAVYQWITASKSLEIAKYPVNFPVSRELAAETGSYVTAHTTNPFKSLAV
jgi:hypothetical protein